MSSVVTDRSQRALPETLARETVQFFKLLSDETRLQILHYLLQQEELNVRSLCELVGQSQPAVSHHLALLRVAGLIEGRREGKHNFYHLCHEHLGAVVRSILRTSQDAISESARETYRQIFRPAAEENEPHAELNEVERDESAHPIQ